MLLNTLKGGDTCDFTAVLPDSCQLRYFCVGKITAYEQYNATKLFL